MDRKNETDLENYFKQKEELEAKIKAGIQKRAKYARKRTKAQNDYEEHEHKKRRLRGFPEEDTTRRHNELLEEANNDLERYRVSFFNRNSVQSETLSSIESEVE